jgi:hypothetical protein
MLLLLQLLFISLSSLHLQQQKSNKGFTHHTRVAIILKKEPLLFEQYAEALGFMFSPKVEKLTLVTPKPFAETYLFVFWEILTRVDKDRRA